MPDHYADVALDGGRFALARVVKQHPYNTRYAIDLTYDVFQSVLDESRCFRLAMHQVFGTPADNSHRSSDLVGQAGRESADGCEPFSALQLAFEGETLAMSFNQIGASVSELFVNSA